MTDPVSANPFHAPRTAFGLGAALLLGFGAMYLFTIRDNSRRNVLETVSEPRAVGDQRFFPLTEKLTKGQQLATFGERVLIASGTELEKKRDSRMEKTGLDETVSFYIYRSTDPADRGFYFLKPANGRYIRCTAK